MLDCLILGDSIALGVGQARPACQTVARTGITSGAWLQTYLPATPVSAGSVVISLGVNDDPSMDTAANLRRLRGSLRAASVTWLLPGLKPDVRRHVTEVARQFGDRVLDTAGEAGPDRLHPSRDGYRVIASWTEQGGAPAATLLAARARPAFAAPAYAAPAYTAVPQTLPMLAPLRPGALPRVQVPSLYGAWPPMATAYAAIPPRDYAFRAIQSLPRR